jgi:hypothetical protein
MLEKIGLEAALRRDPEHAILAPSLQELNVAFVGTE